jgi:hypothetical protein
MALFAWWQAVNAEQKCSGRELLSLVRFFSYLRDKKNDYLGVLGAS